jgi:hypothetical protein
MNIIDTASHCFAIWNNGMMEHWNVGMLVLKYNTEFKATLDFHVKTNMPNTPLPRFPGTHYSSEAKLPQSHCFAAGSRF